MEEKRSQKSLYHKHRHWQSHLKAEANAGVNNSSRTIDSSSEEAEVLNKSCSANIRRGLSEQPE